MKVAIDNVIFQLQHKRPLGIARLWIELLPSLCEEVRKTSGDVILLQRKGTRLPPSEIARTFTIPQFRWNEHPRMVAHACVQCGADVFISTYYSRAAGVPTLLMVYDLIPEALDWKGSEWTAKRRAIMAADGYVTISNTVKTELLRWHPHIVSDNVEVAHLGVSDEFRKPSNMEIADFRQTYRLHAPYVLIVGKRCPYKNTQLAIEAFVSSKLCRSYNMVFVGGGKHPSEQERMLLNQAGAAYSLIDYLTTENLRCAYGGAHCLLYLSSEEGFGLPVLEAMACGCPVVTGASLAVDEVAQDAAWRVSSNNPADVSDALDKLRQHEIRRRYISAGMQRTNLFTWSKTGAKVAAMLRRVIRPLDGPSVQ